MLISLLSDGMKSQEDTKLTFRARTKRRLNSLSAVSIRLERQTEMLKIEVRTDNAAFTDDPSAEVARILRECARKIEAGESNGSLRDINGNKVGFFELDTPLAEFEQADNARA